MFSNEQVSKLTLNSEKSTDISLLEEGCWDVDDDIDEVEDMLVVSDDIDDSPSSDFLQISSNFAAFDVLVVGGNTEMVRKRRMSSFCIFW